MFVGVCVTCDSNDSDVDVDDDDDDDVYAAAACRGSYWSAAATLESDPDGQAFLAVPEVFRPNPLIDEINCFISGFIVRRPVLRSGFHGFRTTEPKRETYIPLICGWNVRCSDFCASTQMPGRSVRKFGMALKSHRDD